MVEFTNVRVHAFHPRYMTVSWEIANIPGGTDYTIDIERSETPDGPWTLIAQGLVDREFYHDWDANQYNLRRRHFYRVTYRDGSGAPVVSPAVTNLNTPDAIAYDIIRREQLALNVLSGRPGFFLIERTWGAPCTFCYDSVAQKTSVSDCPYCYGTRYAGGYFEPIFGYVSQQGLSNLNQQATPIMEMQQVTKQFWTSNSPLLKVRDVFVDAENNRWRVMAISHTEKLGAFMRQIMSMSEVPKGHIIYDIPVPNLYDFHPVRDYHIWETTPFLEP